MAAEKELLLILLRLKELIRGSGDFQYRWLNVPGKPEETPGTLIQRAVGLQAVVVTEANAAQFKQLAPLDVVINIDDEPENADWLHRSRSKKGITESLRDFAKDEGLQSAIDKAEKWRNVLEEMGELTAGGSPEFVSCSLLHDLLNDFLGKVLEQKQKEDAK